jgi:transposase, IS5 family
MRFLGLGLADTVPDANTIWTFREALTRARIAGKPAIEVLFERFHAVLSAAGFLAMSGQIIDASIIAAPKQRNTDGEKRDIKEGRIPPEWAKQPAKLRQKDRDARWTVKYTKAKPSESGAPRVDLAIPAFGYKNHIGIDRRHRPIRRWRVTDAARHDGAVLPELIDRNNTGGDVWADTAYRSKANERFLADRLLRSQIHRKKPKGRPMPRRTARANARKSAVRSALEPVFARQKGPIDLFVRTIGIARARTKIGLANLLYNLQRMIWLTDQATAT